MNNSFLIIGLGKFGLTLTRRLVAEGKDVVVIDRVKSAIDEVADIVTCGICGDPTDEEVLRAAGVQLCDVAIISIATPIDDSALITVLLKDKFKIKTVIARAGSENHTLVLKKLGADAVIFPEKDLAENLAYRLSHSQISRYIELSRTGRIVELALPEKWEGKSIVELRLRQKYGVTVVAVTGPKGEEDYSPDPTVPLYAGEKLILIGNEENIGKIVDAQS